VSARTPCDNIMKLAVVGAGGAGKSTLIARLATGNYLETNMTVGFDVESWIVDTGHNTCIKVALFDLGGQKQFRFFQGSFVLGARLALIVFDCTSFRSLLEVEEWLGMIESIPSSRRLLVGTKADVEGAICDEEISERAKDLGVDYVLISSKTGENFDKLLDKLQEMVRST